MSATAFIKLVEERLGWEAPPGPAHLRYRAEVGKVNRRVAEDPFLYTWDNLHLAVALLAKEKKPRTPLGVFAHVQRALDLAMDRETDVEAEIRKAVAYETELGDPAGWVVRFARAVGGYRAEALQEWRESVR